MNQAPITAGDAAAAQVRRFRLRQDWSVRQLAEECQRLGAPQLTAASLGNIERGQDKNATRKRRDVTVDELLILARALKVAPALLMFPVGQVPEVQVDPGTPVDTWTALKWFSGEAYFNGEADRYWAIPIYLNREHDRWESVLTSVMLGPPIDDDEQVRERSLHELRNVRGEMRRHGMAPPVLPEDLKFVDQRRHAYLTAVEVEAAVVAGETVRQVDDNKPGRGKLQKPGDATRFSEAIERGREFAEQWHRDHPNE